MHSIDAFDRAFDRKFDRAFDREFGRAFGREFDREFDREFGRAFGREIGRARLTAAGRVIEVGPGSRPAKTRFGSGFLTRVFESSRDVRPEYSGRVRGLESSIDPEFPTRPAKT